MLNITNTSSFVFAFLAEGDDGGGLPLWVWLMIIILVILLLWYLWKYLTRPKSTGSQSYPPAPAVKAPEVVGPEPVVRAAEVVIPTAPSPIKPDDLTLLEGIGPKIASLLQAAGITTFTQLAEADLGRLSQILKDAGLQHLANPATWPEQAGLAAAGKWEELKVLTDNLKGGRRVA
jgi:predicted flap endonuclease-1-like 5' DNA nuclease